MKKNLLLIAFISVCFVSNAQVRTLYEMYVKFDKELFFSSPSEYSFTSFFKNPQSQNPRDSSTEVFKIFRNTSGQIDSILGGYHLVFGNDTFSIDTFMPTSKSIGQNFTDSSVYIDYNFENQVWKPTYRISVTTKNGKFNNYYSEYYQQVGGWDGQMHLIGCDYGSGPNQYSVSEYTKGLSTPFGIKTKMTRYYDVNGKIMVDSVYNFNNNFTTYVTYSYPNSTVVLLAGYNSNNSITGKIQFTLDSLSKVNSFTRFINDTPDIIIKFKNAETIHTGINQTVLNNTQIVYPNPVHNILNLSKTIGQYSVIDIAGNVIKADNNFYSNQIDVSLLQAGLYFIQTKDENGIIYYTRFVKQ